MKHLDSHVAVRESSANNWGGSATQKLAALSPTRVMLRQLLILLTVYSISNILLLFNHGIFFDDWIWMTVDIHLLSTGVSQMGYPMLGPLHHLLRHFGVGAYRWVTFLSYLIAAVALLGALNPLKRISQEKRLYLALIFALFPVNTSRIAICTVHYAIAYAFFFVGLLLFSQFTRSGSVISRLTSLAFIAAASYLVNSFLFFCVLVPAFFLYAEDDAIRSLRAALSRLRRIPDFLLLPFAVFLAKTFFGRPYGLYTGYNHISLRRMVESPYHIASSFNSSFLGAIGRSLRLAVSSWPVFGIAIALAVAIALVLYTALFRGRPMPHSSQTERAEKVVAVEGYGLQPVRKLPGTNAALAAEGRPSPRTSLFQQSRTARTAFAHLVFGLLLFVFACLPYSAVGKYVGPWNWDSRNQLLVPLAAAWLIVFGLELVCRGHRRAELLLVSALIAVFVCADVAGLAQFQKDAYKQQSLLLHFKSDTGIRQGTSFFVEDRTPDLDADKRSYQYYEYSAMFYSDFGQESRFAIRTEHAGQIPTLQSKHLLGAEYLLGQFNGQLPNETIQISYGPTRLDTRGLVRLMLDERTNPARYQSEIWNLTQVSTSQ